MIGSVRTVRNSPINYGVCVNTVHYSMCGTLLKEITEVCGYSDLDRLCWSGKGEHALLWKPLTWTGWSCN